ncbi:serine/arginine-rich splicing factor SC35-like [Magnolia sinica]|uniref:serine/arginine-rich splicing factor SC35-like n=1 Tax=Magnolia sinica TaxID=86752 RepID=UPI0026588F62|nr:serine/arginine-rich splicing factor SC35-like [Magnolia sinica]
MEEREREREQEGDRDLEGQWERVSSRKSRHSIYLFCLFAVNLTFDTTEEDLLRIFGRFGKIREVYIPWNRVLNQSRGFTFIQFCYEQDALNAIHCLHERRIDGRVAHVAWAKGQSGTRAETPGTAFPHHQQKKPDSDHHFMNVVS